MRRSGEVTGWAFLAEAGGVRHAGLAVGQAGLGPFTGAGAGGSLATLAQVRGWPRSSLDALPFSEPVDARWCVHRDTEGVVAVFGPGGLELAYDLDLDLPPGWLETVTRTRSLVLVVSHVLPASADMAAVLTYETERGMVCAGRVRFGPPDSGAAGPPTVTYVLDPVSVLVELVLHVRDQVLSLDAAKLRARELERARRSLEEAHGLSAGAMLDLLTGEASRSRGGEAGLLYVYWRLVAEVAEECGADAVWAEAALRTVESAAPVLAERCERAVFEEADAVAGRLIAYTEGSPCLTEALLAAARLRLAVRGPEDLGGDAYAGEERTVRAAQLAADLYRSPLHRPWFGGAWPLLFDERLRDEAQHLLTRAAESIDRESERGRALRPGILVTLAQVLAEDGGVDGETARAAFAALFDAPAAGPPDLPVFLLRWVDDAPATLVDVVRDNVFGSDLSAFLAAHGGAVAARTVGQGVSLARERADRPLLRAVLDWSDRSSLTWGPARRRQLAEARLHALPHDPTDCPAPGDPLPEPLPESFPATWSTAQRSAALLHAAAHARDRQRPALGVALLRQAGGETVRDQTADGGPVPPGRGAGRAGLREGPVPVGPLHVRRSLLRLAEPAGPGPGVPAARPPGDTATPGRRPQERRVRDHRGPPQLRYQRRPGARRGAARSRPRRRMAAHRPHRDDADGADARPPPGGQGPGGGRVAPDRRPAHPARAHRELRRETARPGEPHRRRRRHGEPARRAGRGTRPGGEGDRGGDGRDGFARNLRRRVSSFIDDELRRRSVAFVDDAHLWARTGELLDDRTVLLTWFLPTAVNGAAVLLGVTREGGELTVQLGDPADGGPERAAAYADRHPVADLVEAVRTEVERDPLFGDVTPEGRRLLTGHELPLPAADQWAAWRARGKDRLLLWPHGALHYLPVALCTADGRPIADDWSVTTIVGLEALLPVDGPARPRRTAVLASANGGVPYGLPAEPALEEHARAVAEAVGANPLTGPAATRAGLLAELATADVVHLAVHGTMDQDAPWLHCLYLTPDEDDDGRVFAHDFLELDLSGVRLVTVAACESALGRFDRADNVRGVPAALITAGVQAVVGCLWAVRPEPATYFYHFLHRRAGQAEDLERAFREARAATRAHYPQYRDWGAFTYLLGRSKGAES